MARRRQETASFISLTVEGSLIPPDIVARISQGDSELKGLRPGDYHLASGERLGEAANRAWTRLVGAWAAYKDALAKTPEDDHATGLTRDRWLLILFQELGFGRLQPARKATELDGREYPLSHFWGHVPIHLIGARLDIDKRTAGARGAAQASPHSLVQEFLNRSDDHLWGIVSNGVRLRLLRDNASLARQAYLEFDLEAIFDGDLYADFVLAYMLFHVSRVEGEPPETCWLERWRDTAIREGTRALDQLRAGVEEALAALGSGFLEHPKNDVLRDRLRSGELSTLAYYRQLMRLIYRLIFLFVADDRNLLFGPEASGEARNLYIDNYSTARLRELAERRVGTAHSDLFEILRLVTGWLGDERGCPELGLLDAIRSLSLVDAAGKRRRVDYKNLGAEELGSVYESLLELHPVLSLDAATFELKVASGNERKTTGSYYTPSSLIDELLDRALDPILDRAQQSDDPEAALLDVKVLDPATGSGHFLVAAARRIARRVAQVRTGEEEPPPEAVRHALRDVIARCIYGVDKNEMAAELCRVSLWMEAMEPGKPLAFLDHKILVGDSLVGATPALIKRGIPNEAFAPIEGDDKKIAASYKKRNKLASEGGQLSLAPQRGLESRYSAISAGALELEDAPQDSIYQVGEKEQRYRSLVASDDFEKAKLVADAWCAAFFWPAVTDGPEPVTQEVLTNLVTGDAPVPRRTLDEIDRLARENQFFHFHLAFPDVFSPKDNLAIDSDEVTGWRGGFDVVVGNPPWEQLVTAEQEFFASRDPEIASASGAERKKLIAKLESEQPELHAEFKRAVHNSHATSHFVRSSGRYPLSGTGKINSYAVFAEGMRTLASDAGRVGAVLPSGIATDDTTKFFFQDLVEQSSLVALLDFENRDRVFPAVDSRVKFCLLALTGPESPAAAADFVFFAHSTEDVARPEKQITLSPADIALINPNTKTCPIFRTRRDAEITKAIYERVPVLIDESKGEEGNPWGAQLKQGLFNMTSDSGLFRTREGLEADGWTLKGNIFQRADEQYVPLYEAKMIHQFNHRFGDYSMLPAGSKSTQLPDISDSVLADPNYQPLPRYWVPAADVSARLAGKWDRPWLLGWRDIARSTDERTAISALIPLVGVGDNFLLLLPSSGQLPVVYASLLGNIDAFVYDFVARQKVGGTHMKFFTFKQLPVFSPSTYDASAPWAPAETLADWISSRVLELVYTSWGLEPFARDLGYDGPPFAWDPERRFQLRCELDAAFFHLYGINADDAAYILDTFPIVRRHDEATYGTYRTKDTILTLMESMK
ncbi:MAG: restriction endonuclease [Acidobacteria bacterium]|nr:MAG: restriction endonuclease [Acidobacteriota bacterium]